MIGWPGEELDSEVLGLRLVVREDWLRLLNPATGRPCCPRRRSKPPALAEQTAVLAQQAAALSAAEAENERLRAEIARLRGPA